MPSAQTSHKRKRATDGPNHPDRKKKTKPRFKKMKPSAYHSSSEEEPDERNASGPNSTAIGVRKPKDEIEIKKTEEGLQAVSGAVAGEQEASESEDNGSGIQLPNLQDDNAEDNEDADNDEFDVADAPSEQDEEDSEDSEDDNDDEIATTQASGGNRRQTKKRNDPTAFASSISAILSSKLTTSKRADPVLARSATAASNAEQRADIKLEAQAKKKMTHDKKALQDKGHVRDILGVQTTEVSAAAVAEHEKRLRKMAQRGVVKLFNAVRAAQVKGEEARGEVQRVPGEVVGIDRRAEKVNEMSKQGFLDLLTGET
ncbi:hypothetical protein FH972_024519 [Carpinus fangiana]|uniref:Rrp15p-domain-containing protein n=1 Tax=Carpinus fangiana TaxID=176857 RepID=A0A5N6KY88_9ROSI|nr:hypothetical protein FH972_024519 [Carpinus fangiana]